MDQSLIVELHPESWAEVRELGLLQHIPHIFRGQENASWGLAPSFERAIERGGVAAVDAVDREAWILREFARRSGNHDIRISEDAPLDALALLQHYGGPSRLLDFSHSLYVAAFFALEFAQNPAVIWAINLIMLERAIARILDLPDEAGFFRLSHGKYDPIAREVIEGKRRAELVIPVEPFHMHERMSIQQGLFLFPCSLAVGFEHNLAASFGCPVEALRKPTPMKVADYRRSKISEIAITRIVLSRRIRRSILEDLWLMNINSATLFPGLDGFARSFHYHVRAMSNIEPWFLEDDE